MGLSHWEIHDNPITSYIALDDIKKVYLAKVWNNTFHIVGKKLDHLHLKDFLKCKCELYLKKPLASPHHKINVVYRPLTIDLQ